MDPAISPPEWQQTSQCHFPYLFSIILQSFIKCDYFTFRSLDPAISPPQWQQTSQCHSPIPIFNCIAKLRLDEPSTLDDLEDINSLIDTEVGVANLNQNEFENNQLMAQFQQDMAKIKVCEFLNQVFLNIFQRLNRFQ